MWRSPSASSITVREITSHTAFVAWLPLPTGQTYASAVMAEAGKKIVPVLNNASSASRVFGARYDKTAAARIVNAITKGQRWKPSVSFFDPKNSMVLVDGVPIMKNTDGNSAKKLELEPLMAAYKSGTIYWSTSLVTQPPAVHLAQMVQELAHHFDKQLNRENLGKGEGIRLLAAVHGSYTKHHDNLHKYQDVADVVIGGKTVRGAELGFTRWMGRVAVAAAVVVVVGALVVAPELAPLAGEAVEDLLALEQIAEDSAAVVQGVENAEALLTEEVAESEEWEVFKGRRANGRQATRGNFSYTDATRRHIAKHLRPDFAKDAHSVFHARGEQSMFRLINEARLRYTGNGVRQGGRTIVKDLDMGRVIGDVIRNKNGVQVESRAKRYIRLVFRTEAGAGEELATAYPILPPS